MDFRGSHMISVLRLLAAGLFLEGPASSVSTDLCLRNHMNPHAWRDLAGSKGQRLVTLESGGTWISVLCMATCLFRKSARCSG